MKILRLFLLTIFATFLNAQISRYPDSGAGSLTVLNVAQTNSTVLTIGGNCSSTNPCNVRFGNIVYSIAQSATATVSAGTGTAYVYVDTGGTLTVGHNLTLTCSAGCTATAGITAFPTTSIPLTTWTATAGTWDTTGGLEKKAFLSTKLITTSNGALSSETNGTTNISVDWTNVTFSVEATPTLAQINAGFNLLTATVGTTYKVVGFWLQVNGTFLTCTDVRVSDTAVTPVDVFSIAVASLTNNMLANEATVGAGSLGTFTTALTADKGVQIRQTGTACTGGTSIKIRLFYKRNS